MDFKHPLEENKPTSVYEIAFGTHKATVSTGQSNAIMH
jgi:hypothetical protein